MPQGTEIYIISGTGKSAQANPYGLAVNTDSLSMDSLAALARKKYGKPVANDLAVTNKNQRPSATLRVLNKASQIKGPYMPADLTADSVPDYDNWGPDDYWSCAAFIKWHQLLEAKYGLQEANLRFMNAFEEAWSFASYHKDDCPYDQAFRNYFRSKGIQIETVGSFLSMTLFEVADDAADTATSLSSAVSSVGTVIKYTAGAAAVLGLLYLGAKAYQEVKNK